MNPEFGKEVGVVGMEHGPVDHAEAQIGRTSAAGVKLDVHRPHAPVGFEADAVGNGEVVALAGHDHVGIAVEPELAGPAGGAGGESGDDRPLRRLRLLAAEAAAHAAHAAGHEGIRQRENAGDDVLHFARMLSGRIDQHGAVLARHGERDLAFQIKVFLAANVERAGTAKRRCRDRFGGIAVDEGVVGKNALAGRFALLDGDVRALRFDIEARAERRAPRRIARRRNDGEHGLAMENDADPWQTPAHRQTPAKRRSCPVCPPR